MPERLPAPAPRPRPARPVPDDDALEDLVDAPLDDLADPLDGLDDLPDDEPLDLDEPVDLDEPAGADLPSLHEVDDVPDDAPLDLEEPTPEAPEIDLDEPVVLPWQTHATLPELGLTVSAVLDPTRAVTRLTGVDLPAAPVRVVLGGVEAVVVPEAAEGRPLLQVGRDVLAGRVQVEVPR